MLDFSDLDSPDPLKRELAYLRLLEELLGSDLVERWAGERGKLEALREWRKVARAKPRQRYRGEQNRIARGR